MQNRLVSIRYLVVALLLLATVSNLSADRVTKKTRKRKKKTSAKLDDPCSLRSPVAASPDAMALSSHDRNELLQASLQTVFSIASKACENKENLKCFVGFNMFREKMPDMLEGYTNAGVALERLGRLRDAKIMYRAAMKNIPDNGRAVSALVNVLQMEAIKAYEKGQYQTALDRYSEIVKRAPSIAGVHVNLGNIYEALQRYDEAASVYKQAIEQSPNDVQNFNAMCRLRLMEVSGGAVGRFGITRAQRITSFEEAKVYCMQAVAVAKDDKLANMNLGMLYKESLEFDLAVKHMKKALEKDPNDVIVMTNLATTLSRMDRVPAAVQYIEKIIKINDSPEAHFSIGTISAPHDRLSQKGLASHAKGQDLAVSRGPRVPQGATCQHNLPHRKLVRSWLATDSVHVDIVDMVDQNEHFGTAKGPRTLHDVALDETDIGPVPLLFIDKQTVALTLRDVSVEGAGGVMFTDCEVYLTIGLSTNLPRDYKGGNNEVVTVTHPVVSVIHPSISNYYHFTAEVATRMLLSFEYYFGDNGVAKDAQLLLPPRYESQLPWDFITMLGITLKHTPLEYTPGNGKSYHFSTLHRIDWVQLNTDDPDNNDLWSDYLPSRIALFKLRDTARRHQASRPSSIKMRSRPVVYICRAGVREVTSEEMLLDALKLLLGDNVYIHDTAGRTGAATVTTLQDQLDLFEGAQIIMGAHGAGLVNMVYAPDNATVIEFPMSPQCNRCFGYMATALQQDYWIVPEVSTFYHLKYKMTRSKMKAVLNVLKAVLDEKGLSDLMRSGFDWSGLDGGIKDEL
eukprot:m.61258 g.61258  ORF g.61258 m.61258 type:complete len:795 (+) comp8013_c1_seq1:131-2515(+)